MSVAGAVLAALLPVGGLVVAGCAPETDQAGSATRGAATDTVTVYEAVRGGYRLAAVSAAVPARPEGKSSDSDALVARDQQLAWTVVVNSKAALGAPPFAPVVVQDGSGLRWRPIRPDDSFLPPGPPY